MKWKVGQTVMVQSRTWANINKPGGCARITKIHTAEEESSYVEGLDVKYVVDGRKEKSLDPAIVTPYEHLERGGRKRRGRDFLMKREEDALLEEQKAPQRNKAPAKQAAPPANAQGMARAGKENRSSPQSSPTCSTPERPPKPAKKPKQVTPIPKMVITGRKIDDVSPLIEDLPSLRRPHTKAKSDQKAEKKPVARGLVFDASEPRNPGAKESSLPPKNAHAASASVSHANKPRLPGTKECGKIDTVLSRPGSALMDKKAAGFVLKPPRKVPPSSTHSTDNPNRCRSNHKTTTKKAVPPKSHPLGAFGTKPRPHFKPATASFSRVTSAYDTKNKAETNRKPLLDVYRAEVQKAREFMDEMVGHRSDRDNQKKGFFSTTKSRYDEFLSHLYKVWIKIDEEEVSEEEFREVYNTIAPNSFTSEELDRHVQRMCDEGKEVMKSDGMLYRIH
ncbi:unnamed protein product [Pseudo-nitzschia multistriata]|uniref:Uncharacterized protein n=1 Tax=Pseudo-nitzschia multistriata TaxID=183589 RepID=A0A448ZGZ7_9STRA|nr:unnamed protein product [Pseudo-nitzschia multistriata]